MISCCLWHTLSRLITLQCTPTVRTWPGQRCVPCEEHDFPCGPNVHSRQSTSTKLGNTSSPALDIVAGVEPQTVKAGKISRWECVNGLDCPWSLTDLEADNSDLMNHILSMPFEEPQLQKENWSGIVVGQTDKPSRESLSARPGFVNLTPTADQLEIDQRYVNL